MKNREISADWFNTEEKKMTFKNAILKLKVIEARSRSACEVYNLIENVHQLHIGSFDEFSQKMWQNIDIFCFVFKSCSLKTYLQLINILFGWQTELPYLKRQQEQLNFWCDNSWKTIYFDNYLVVYPQFLIN